MHVDVNTLKEAVLQAVQNGPLVHAVRDVQIEPAQDQDDEEFLRVALSVQLPNHDVDAELEALLEQIEKAVAALDDRYASVRFLDAA
jgi:hypothetical protein